jgi:hypothetical protein
LGYLLAVGNLAGRPGPSLANMNEFWASLTPQLGPLLVTTVGLIAALVVKSGRRRRLDNLKAAADTLRQLEATEHRTAVTAYMDRQSSALSRQIDPLFIWVGLSALVVIGAGVLLGLFIGLPPIDLEEFSTLVPAVVILVLGTVVGSIASWWQHLHAKRLERKAQERKAQVRAAHARVTKPQRRLFRPARSRAG